MTADRLQAILDQLPAHQHQSARDRIAESESFAWRDIVLYRLPGQTEKSDEKDLFGTKPNGDEAFLP